MSGGSGRRFWPLSRTGRAKQLIPLIGGESLLALTVGRLEPLFAPESIVVVTQERQHVETARALEPFGGVRILSEPVGKNTAPCIALAACYIEKHFGEAVAAFLPADHFIGRPDAFRAVLAAGMGFVEETGDHLTLGITPARPATGFGYMRRGSKVADREDFTFYRVDEFAEKPSLETARAYIESGEYFWNAGIFVFKTSSILREIGERLPHTGSELEALKQSLGTPREGEVLRPFYARVEEISIDFAVMEKTSAACMVPADIDWDDLGTWESFSRHMARDEAGNAVHGRHIGIDTEDCLVYGDGQLIATLGLSGIAVISTGDAVLVIPKKRGEEVKRIVERIEKEGLAEFL
jgi:mannose-1-phosphate guanylyltransferase